MPVKVTISATDSAFATFTTFSASHPAGRPSCFPCCLASSIPARLFCWLLLALVKSLVQRLLSSFSNPGFTVGVDDDLAVA